MTTATNWLYALLLAFALSASGCLDDHSSENKTAIAMEQSQRDEVAAYRISQQWQKACDSKHGPNSAYEMGDDGILVCSTRRGWVAFNEGVK